MEIQKELIIWLIERRKTLCINFAPKKVIDKRASNKKPNIMQAALFLLSQTLLYLQHTMGPKSQLSEFKHVARSQVHIACVLCWNRRPCFCFLFNLLTGESAQQREIYYEDAVWRKMTPRIELYQRRFSSELIYEYNAWESYTRSLRACAVNLI
jgi:hypothetical protein